MSDSPKNASMETNIIPETLIQYPEPQMDDPGTPVQNPDDQNQDPDDLRQDPDDDVAKQTISFKIKHALSFKRELEVLRDDDCNPNGSAELKLWNKAIAIVTFNPQTKVLAGLCSSTRLLRSDDAPQPLVSKKFIYLDDLSKLLAVESDRDSIEVKHVIGLDVVSLKLIDLGSPRTFSLEFADISCDSEEFATTIDNDGYEVYIPTENFKDIIQQFENTERGSTSKNVVFRIAGGSSRIWMKDVQECTSGHNNLVQGYEAFGLPGGQTLEAEFHWPHWKSLEKASNLYEHAIFTFPKMQPYNMYLEFIVGSHHLWYVMDQARMKKFELSTE